MPKPFSYGDAVKLLGAKESKVVRAIDKLLGGVLLGGSISGVSDLLGWFDAKADFVRFSHELVINAAERRAGLSRFSRTQRLEAAHAVVVLLAFFQAYDDLRLPIEFADLDLTRERQLSLAGKNANLTNVFELSLPLPTAERPYEVNVYQLQSFYLELSQELLELLTGLGVWDRLTETQQDALSEALGTRGRLAPMALRRYEEQLRGLAADFPEIRFWQSVQDSQATRTEVRKVGVALARVEQLLQRADNEWSPESRCAGLAAKNQAVLDHPIIEPDRTTGSLRIPRYRDAYVDPNFQVARMVPDATPAQLAWWHGFGVRRDVHRYLAGYLTSPDATARPLLVLGDPGSGKSMLTRVLAARLPSNEFLALRVELRTTPVEADLLAQIEHAIRDAFKEDISWAALARAAGRALPVILLDGFDELLQATGVSQTNYLVKIAEFQRDCLELGRPVAVLVTSRISVADRARVPNESLVLRLVPFDGHQTSTWLATWNAANTVHFAAHRLRPLDREVALSYPDLAAQPLLLLMLALYDADDNALQRGVGRIGELELYERLLTRFARREVMRDEEDRPDEALHAEAEVELQRLSAVAFAMFNRGSQWVTESDLDVDFAALFGVRTSKQGTRTPLTAGEAVVGRFFFIQRAQAVRDGTPLRTYEFLHATFGEFLVARFTWSVLLDLYATESTRRPSMLARGLDDGNLHALLSFAPLCGRSSVTGFLAELAGSLSHAERNDLAAFVVRLHAGLDVVNPERTTIPYEPTRLSPPARHATYSVNLVLLAVIIRGDGLLASELLGADADIVPAWRKLTLLWQSQLISNDWDALIHTLELTRLWNGDDRDIRLAIGARGVDRTTVEWIFAGTTGDYDEILREVHFTCSGSAEVVSHAIEPIAEWYPDSLNTVVADASTANVVVRLMLSCSDDRDARLAALRRVASSALLDTDEELEIELVPSLTDLLVQAVTAWPPLDPLSLPAEVVDVCGDHLEFLAYLYGSLGMNRTDDERLRRMIEMADPGDSAVDEIPEAVVDAWLRKHERAPGSGRPSTQADELVGLLSQIDLRVLQHHRSDLVTRLRRAAAALGVDGDYTW